MILVVNAGSSSLKISFFNKTARRCLGHDSFTWNGGQKACIDALMQAVSSFCAKKKDSIEVVAHRFVHGKDEFTKPLLLCEKHLQKLSAMAYLAPLHNVRCVEAARACLSYLPRARHVAFFDTAFYAFMPKTAKEYALPFDIAEKTGTYRYGFHGIAHESLWHALKKYGFAKMITLHLGNGCSATAMRKGRPLDTSMGLTPLEGLVMGTRSGDIDAAVIGHLCRTLNKPVHWVENVLNQRSGLLGVSALSADVGVLLKADCARARLALDLFCYRIVKYIGAYGAVLQGVDAIAFSGGIGENAFVLRQRIIDEMKWLGACIDCASNEKAVSLAPGQVCRLDGKKSRIAVFAVGSLENAFMAKQALKVS